jgi:hypothetical protein
LQQSSYCHLHAVVMMGGQQTQVVTHIGHADVGLRQIGIGTQVQARRGV